MHLNTTMQNAPHHQEEGQADPLAWLPAKKTAPSRAPYVPPTVTPARSDALAHSLCPSRDGDKFTPHTTPKAMCTGPGRGIYGPGRINARSVAV